MANDYFNHVANRVQAGTRAIAANVNSVADEIATGLDLLPTEDELKLGLTRYAVDTGAADAYVLTMPYVPSLTDGFNLTFKAVNANTGASTMNVNGTGIKSIVNPDGSALIAGTFGANAIIILAYESIGDRYILVSQNPAQAALAQSSAIASAVSAAAALVSENNAATSESNASTSASNASTSETNAGTSETNAGTSETNAGIDAAAALADRLLFEQSYLGWKAGDPALDNEGNALIDGALYWNTTTNQMNVYDLGGTSWGALQDGGNAATLGGIAPASFLRSDVDDTFTGVMTVAGRIDVDNLRIDGNTISAPSSGGIILTAFAGSAVSVEGVSFDGGVVTGASAISATNFTGALAGNSTTSSNTTGNAATVTTNANLTGGVTSVGNAATVVTNANLTGGVTSVGNAATVVTNANLTGPVTSVGNATAITNDAVTNAKLANVATSTIKGRSTAATGDPEDLTAAQVRLILAPAGILLEEEVFTSDGTWTKPAGTLAVEVEIIGGGGSGGGCVLTGSTQTSAGKSGGGGAYSYKRIASGLGATETVTVGVGGVAPGAPTSQGETGDDGEDSSFGTHLVSGGGDAGPSQSLTGVDVNQYYGANGGVADAGADIGIDGGRGDWGMIAGAVGNHGSRGGVAPVYGGHHRTQGTHGGQTTAPADALIYGGGGEGAVNNESKAARVGSAGADGLVIVRSYG